MHRAEAILAASYIFIVHFFIGHLRPSSFPMNEAMFSGSVTLEEAMEEKPVWVERLKSEGKLELANPKPPAPLVQGTLFCFRVHGLGLWPLFACERNRLQPLYKIALTIRLGNCTIY